MRPREIVGVVVFLSLLALLVALVAREPKDQNLVENVILLGVDTMRYDHAMNPDLSPNIVRWAERGVVFDRAISPCSWTKPAVASWFTGMLPPAHGMEENTDTVIEEHYTLAERFKNAGWATGGIIANGTVSARGYDQGFDSYEIAPLTMECGATPRADAILPDAQSVLKYTLDWIDNTPSPWFHFMFAVDPHDPYFAHRDEPYEEHGCRSTLWYFDAHRDVPGVADHREYVHALYDGEVAHFDQMFGELMERLRSRGLLEKTAVILVADHGETLWGYRDYRKHGAYLNQELIHVPLIVWWPGEKPRHIPMPTGATGLYKTLSDRLELGDCAGVERGLFDEQPLIYSFVNYLSDGRRNDRTSVIDWPWKLIVDHEGGPDELYNLADDADENLPVAYPAKQAQLRQLIRAKLAHGTETLKHIGSPVETGLSEDDKRAMEALGYL